MLDGFLLYREITCRHVTFSPYCIDNTFGVLNQLWNWACAPRTLRFARRKWATGEVCRSPDCRQYRRLAHGIAHSGSKCMLASRFVCTATSSRCKIDECADLRIHCRITDAARGGRLVHANDLESLTHVLDRDAGDDCAAPRH